MLKTNEDIRDIFFGNINKLFKKKKDLYILTNDADVFAFKDIKRNKRFLDVGVCEQNLINIAAGLASQKKRVIIFGFCNFLIHRAFEQIKINIASMNLPVNIVGIGPGFSFPYDGPTHHATQDISNINSLPEFEIINISEPNLANYVSKNILRNKCPTYIRIDKGVFPSQKFDNFDKGYSFYYKKKNKKNKKLVISSGYFSHKALEITKKNKSFDLLDIYKIRINEKIFLHDIRQYKKVIFYDENTYEGGITPIILRVLLKAKKNFKIYYKLVPSKQIFLYSQSREDLFKKLKIDKKNLENFLRNLNN